VNPATPEPVSETSSLLHSPLTALSWARVLLFAKQHGIVAGLCLVMAYQLGIMASAQSYMCGV
jgi:hypothetical protein